LRFQLYSIAYLIAVWSILLKTKKTCTMEMSNSVTI
jgi:hypothetical protein